MILMDFSNIAVRSVLRDGEAADNINISLTRHALLRSILYYRRKFNEYGELVICCDSKNNWRKQYFEHYKAKRKKDQKESFIDWDKVYEFIEITKKEISEAFPYRLIEIPNMEGDDVIASIVIAKYRKEKCMIVSSDEDFIQLQKFENVEQYSPTTKDFLTTENLDYFIFEHIVRGDVADGIPNILSDLDTFVDETKRQKQLRKTKVDLWYDSRDIDDSLNERFELNKKLVDLTMIPVELQEKAVEKFNSYNLEELNSRRKQLYGYLTKNKLFNILEDVGVF
jgi:5'-3' exonuclease